MKPPPRFPSRTLRTCGSLVLLCAAGCGATSELVDVRFTPPNAYYYVNGESQGQASRVKSIRFSFDEHPRVILQAAAEGYRPYYSVWTSEQIEQKVDSGDVIRVEMEPY